MGLAIHSFYFNSIFCYYFNEWIYWQENPCKHLASLGRNSGSEKHKLHVWFIEGNPGWQYFLDKLANGSIPSQIRTFSRIPQNVPSINTNVRRNISITLQHYLLVNQRIMSSLVLTVSEYCHHGTMDWGPLLTTPTRTRLAPQWLPIQIFLNAWFGRLWSQSNVT